MIICLIIYSIYVLSAIVSSFSAFRLNPSISQWVERAGTATGASLRGFAYASDKKALQAFGNIIFVLAAVMFVVAVVFNKIVGEGFRQLLTVGFVFCIYSSGSIGAWANNREKILREFFETAKTDSENYGKLYLIVSTLIFSIFTAIGVIAGELSFSYLGVMGGIVVLGLVAIVFIIILTKTISVMIVFAPALLMIALLWASMIVVRQVLEIGKNRLLNIINLYFLLGSIYLGLLSFPGLRVWLKVPAICQ